MILRTTIKQLVVYGGTDAASYAKVKSEILSNNRAIVKGFSLLATVVLAVLVIVSLVLPSFSNYRPLYVGGFIAALIIWLVARFPGKTNNTVMLIDMYVFIALLLAIGIVLGTVLSPKEIAATYIAFLLTVPQIFTDRPYRMYILIVLSMLVFIAMVIIVKNPATWNSDITNVILFGIISLILCTYSMHNRISRYCLQEKIRFMAENDQLTGLRNRNCYEASLENAAVLEASGSTVCMPT